MRANTHTTMPLPTRRDRRAPSRPGTSNASCRPESRRQPACQPGGTHPRPACGRHCANNPPTATATDRTEPQRGETIRTTSVSQSTTTTAPPAPEQTPAPEAAIAKVATRPWSPGSNRSRTPITAGPSNLTDDRPQPAKHRPSPRPRDEWSPGRMRGTMKPSWGERFASRMRGESGMSTAEYAVGTLAAVAFAGVLLKVLTSGAVQGALSELIERALS